MSADANASSNGAHANGINGLNGHAPFSRPLKPGIYAPVPTFFFPGSEDLDLESLTAHVAYVGKAGAAPLVAGSTGEAIHLSHEERAAVIRTARKALDDAGLTDLPVIAGTGAGSTRETVQLCKEAAQAGADYAIVIASGYFAGVLASDRAALKAYWKEVATKSPLPVILYNFPGASGGIDIDSDFIVEMAEECPNIVGVKLTCGNVGKLTRICATVTSPSFISSHPRKDPNARFIVLGGYADFILPSSFVNGHGAITGLANIAPYTLAVLYAQTVASHSEQSILASAQDLQGAVARADFTISKTSIAGTKALIEKLHGYGGVPRRPLPPIEPEAFKALWEHPHTQEIVRLEREAKATREGAATK